MTSLQKTPDRTNWKRAAMAVLCRPPCQSTSRFFETPCMSQSSPIGNGELVKMPAPMLDAHQQCLQLSPRSRHFNKLAPAPVTDDPSHPVCAARACLRSPIGLRLNVTLLIRCVLRKHAGRHFEEDWRTSPRRAPERRRAVRDWSPMTIPMSSAMVQWCSTGCRKGRLSWTV